MTGIKESHEQPDNEGAVTIIIHDKKLYLYLLLLLLQNQKLGYGSSLCVPREDCLVFPIGFTGTLPCRAVVA